MDGEEIPETNCVKYLGIQLQSNLSWSQHIQNLRTKTAHAIGLLYKFKNKFNRNTKLMIYNAIVQSHFNYLAILYGWKNTTELKSLQRLQNKALKIVSNLPITYSTYSLYSIEFKTILPIRGLYKMQIMLFVYKCMNNLGHHTIQFYRNQQSFNTRNSSNLAVARCRLELTKQRVEYMGVREFNNLPQTMKILNRISNFKNSLKSFLLSNIEELLI